MDSYKTVDEYILNAGKNKALLLVLREILLETELKETIKWGAPCYTINDKNVIGLASFKSYVGLWFHQGVYLTDPKKVLINAQEGTTKALRQWRFTETSELDPPTLKTYILEAIQNQKEGKELKSVKAKNIPLPKEFKAILDSDSMLNKHFTKLTPGKQREYYEYIVSAKQEKTKHSRIEKIRPLILADKGLNDQYK